MFQKSSGIKNIIHGRRHHAFGEMFLSQIAEKKCGGTLLYFKKNLAPKKFMHTRRHDGFENFLCQRAETKKFLREPFYVSEIFCYEKSFCIRGFYFFWYGISWFSVQNIFSHTAGKLRQGTFSCFRKILVRTKILGIRARANHDFLAETFRLTVPIKFVWEPFCVSKKTW